MEDELTGTCCGCIWCGECSESTDEDKSVRCDYYTSFDDEELSIEEYEKDLKMRVSAYQEIVWEQDM